MSSICRVIGLSSFLLMLGALYGCEETYGTSDAEMVRQMYDLTDEILSFDCLPLGIRSSLEESKNLRHHHPGITKESIQTMQAYVDLRKKRKRSRATCEELQSE